MTEHLAYEKLKIFGHSSIVSRNSKDIEDLHLMHPYSLKSLKQLTIYGANTWYQSKGGQCSVMGLLKQFMIWRLKSLHITPLFLDLKEVL